MRAGSGLEDNCNWCECRTAPACMELHCTATPCLLEPALLSTVQAARPGWSPALAPQLWGRTREEGAARLLGVAWPKPPLLTPIRPRPRPRLPTSFSSETAWPGLVAGPGELVDTEHNCPASWAVAAAAVVGDRASIVRSRPLRLSAHSLFARAELECGVTAEPGLAWHLFRTRGATAADCVAGTDCRRHRTSPGYRVGRPASRERDIRMEIHEQVYTIMKQFSRT